MNYNNIFNTALSYTSDTDEMKAFLIREYKKAEREFYTIDSFYNGLLKTVTQKRKLIEKAFNKEVENLEQTIKDIDKYTFYPQATEKRLSDYSNEELEAYQTEARKKLLVSAQSKLKNISISNFQTNIAPLASIELFEQTIKELFKISQEQNNTIESEQAKKPQRKQGRPKTEIHEASYYLHNKELLQFLIDNYSNTEPRNFNQLLSVLADIEINQLKPATKKEYNVAFGKALNVKQKQSNFDNYFNAIRIDEIFEPIKATIKTYLEQ